MSLRSFSRWSWVPLVPLLAGACTSRDLVCEHPTYFKILNPDEGAGVAPFGIARLGPEVNSNDFDGVPAALRLKSRNRVVVDWESHGRILGGDNLIFLPADELAQSDITGLDDFYPMKHFTDGALERVRFGFKARWCPDPETCTNANEKQFLAVEMTCHRDRSSDWWDL